MAQRHELFSVRNIIFAGLILTVLYGTYSYNTMKNRLSTSQANFLTLRSEVAQGANQMKAAMKSRMACMKDVKQLRSTIWELRTKLADLETESNKQKHDVETRVVSLKKESEGWKAQYDELQKELMKLKEEDRVKLVKNREQSEESEVKLRKLVTENEMALTKLRDNLQDVKSENERLKVALAAAKRHIGKSGDSLPAANPKHSEGEEPARQVMPPGVGNQGDKKIGVNTTTQRPESNTFKRANKVESKTLGKDTTEEKSKTDSKDTTEEKSKTDGKDTNKVESKTDGKDTTKVESKTLGKDTTKVESKTDGKDTTKVESKTDAKSTTKVESKDRLRWPSKIMSNHKTRTAETLAAMAKIGTSDVEEKEALKSKQRVLKKRKVAKAPSNSDESEKEENENPKNQKDKAAEGNESHKDEVEVPEDSEPQKQKVAKAEDKVIAETKAEDSKKSNVKAGESQAVDSKISNDKQLVFKERKENTEVKPNVNGAEGKEEVKPKIESQKNENLLGGLADRIKQDRAAAAKEEIPQQQVDMPIPRAAARRNNEPNQLPQPAQPGAALDGNKKDPLLPKPQGAAANEDKRLL